MIYVLLATGFEEIEALAFVDILRSAGIDTKTVATDNSETVTGSHGIQIVADIKIKDIDKFAVDAVVLPGGLPGAYNLRDNADVKELLDYAYQNNITIGAICASPCIVLYNFGYLDGINATVNPGFETEMSNASMLDQRVVCDGNIITSPGPGTTHEFAKAFVSKFKGQRIADELITEMLYK